MDELYPKEHYKKQPKKKPKHGEKLINYSHTDTYSLLDKYKDGADSDRDRMMFMLQSLFNSLAVIPSLDLGFIDQKELILSGDGSSLHIHASRSGHKASAGNDDDPVYRFSAPDADFGWDSSLDSFYLGFTFYNISYHNPSRNIDLPVFISLEKASRHDALTSVSATAQLLDMNPDLRPKYMCLDSASDSLPIYQYLCLNHIIPVIDRNPRRDSSKSNSEKSNLSSNGIPVCMAGHEMINHGYDYNRCRRKFRCPYVMGKVDSCPLKDQCSSSDYGRVVYINDGDDARNGGPLLYRSEKWKKIYKNRTCTERINNRVLNDYHLHQMTIRNGPKNAFFCIFAGINIHLDAWIKDKD
ncbi:MAG: transposase [Faecalicoccus sp.]|nr:transposase [Faecalicoccus sp.]